MEHSKSVRILNIWCGHPSSLHEPLSFLTTHEIITTKSPSTTKLDKPKAFLIMIVLRPLLLLLLSFLVIILILFIIIVVVVVV